MNRPGRLAEWLLRLTEGDSAPPAPAGSERLEGLRRVIAAYAALHRPALHEPHAVLFRWGHLEALERIGSGSHGEVWRAFDRVLERDVALKLRSSDEVAARAYILEARRLARVRDPHVLAVHGAAVNDGRAGMWADLIDGQTLAAWVAACGPRPRAQVLAAARMLARALLAVHRAGLIHGDVKPGNIMRAADGNVILMDFGAAIERAADGARATLGSPLSMAPEQLAGARIGPAVDLYALGVVLFHLATGRYPLEADSIDELCVRHAHGARVDTTGLRRALGRAPARLIGRLLAHDPGARPTAADTLDALHLIERAPARRHRRLALAAVIAALSLGLAAASVGYLRARQEIRRVEQVKGFVLSLFEQANAFDKSSSGQATAADLLRSGAQRVQRELTGQPRIQAELLATIGGGLWRLGAFDDARAADLFALRLLERMRQPDADTQARVHKTLGSIARGDGDPVLARRHYERALAISERGAVTAATRFSILTGLSSLAADAGEHAQAMSISQRLLRERIALHGERHPDVAMDYFNVATGHVRNDQYAAAERAYRKSAAILDDTLGARHPRRLYVTQGLATALRLQGKLAEADELLAAGTRDLRARDMAGTQLHATLLRTWASTLRLQHRAGAALALADEAAAIDDLAIVQRAAALHERGKCLAALARWRDAEAAFAAAEQAYADAKARPDLRNLARGQRAYAAWRDQADTTARSRIEAALDTIGRAETRSSQEWSTLAILLGRLLRKQGQPALALDWQQRARDSIVARGYMGTIGRAAVDAELALTVASLPAMSAQSARARLDAALTALESVDPAHPLCEELIAARAMIGAAAAHAGLTVHAGS